MGLFLFLGSRIGALLGKKEAKTFHFSSFSNRKNKAIQLFLLLKLLDN